MTVTKCPDCGSTDTTFKTKAQQWECNDCEVRFENIEYNSRPKRIFLSYPHRPVKHSQLVEDVARVIKEKGHEPWFDKNKITPGYDWRTSIAKGVLDSDWMIIFMSEEALKPGGVCLDEVGIALHQKSGDETLLTVLLEDESKANPPLSLTRVQWLDAKNFEDYYPKDRNDDEAVKKWNKWLDDEVTKLIRHIDKKGDITGEISALRRRLHPSSFVAEIAYSSKGFVGRKWIFDEIKDWQENNRELRTFVLQGPAGFGKSAIASQLSQQLRDVIGIYFCKHNDASTKDAGNLVRTMIFQIASRNPDYRTWLFDKLKEPQFEGNKLILSNASELFRELLANAPQINSENKSRQLLVIDGLDEARDEKNQNAILKLIDREFDKLPEHIGVVITTRPEQDILSFLKTPYPLLVGDSQNRDDIRKYLSEQFELANILANDSVIKEQAIDSAVEKSDGVILYATELVKSIKERRIDPANPKGFPIGLSGFYLSFMQREFPDVAIYKDTSAKLLELITASPLPITGPLIRKILNIDKSDFNAYVKRLSTLLLIDDGFSDTSLSLFHKSFVDWLIEPTYRHDYQLEGNGAITIGNYLYDQFKLKIKFLEGKNPDLSWGIAELLPLCLSELEAWDNKLALLELEQHYFDTKNYVAALVPAKRLVEINEKSINNQSIEFLNSLNNLAVINIYLGNYEVASDIFNRIMKIIQKGSLNIHPNIFKYWDKLINVKFLQKNTVFEELRLVNYLAELVFATLSSLYHDEDIFTLNSFNHYADSIYSICNLSERTVSEIEVILSASKPILSEKYSLTSMGIRTVFSMLINYGEISAVKQIINEISKAAEIENNKDLSSFSHIRHFALAYYNLSEFDKSRYLLESLVRLQKRDLGIDDINTLTNMNLLGDVYIRLNDFERAQVVLEELVEHDLKFHGEISSSVLDSLATLVEALYQNKEKEKAHSLNIRLCSFNFGVFDHGFLVWLRSSVLQLIQIGDYTKARTLVSYIIDLCTDEFGRSHEETIESMLCLAALLKYQKEWREAYYLLQKVLIIQKTKYGVSHSKTLVTMSYIVDILLIESRFEEALTANLELCGLLLGSNHPLIKKNVKDLENLKVAQNNVEKAHSFLDQRLITEAYVLFEESANLLTAIFGGQHHLTLDVMQKLGIVCAYLGDLESAKECLEKVYKVRESFLGNRHSDTIKSAYNLAMVLRNLDDFEEAIRLCGMSYRYYVDNLGENHTESLVAKRGIGSIYFKKGALEEAKSILEETLAAQRSHVGESDHTTLITMKDLAELYESLGEHKRAEEFKEEYARICDALDE